MTEENRTGDFWTPPVVQIVCVTLKIKRDLNLALKWASRMTRCGKLGKIFGQNKSNQLYCW